MKPNHSAPSLVKLIVASLSFLGAFLGNSAASAQEGAKEPPRLLALRKSWQTARERATAPIDAVYVRELQSLRESLAKEGKLDEAVAVKHEQDVVAGGSVPVGSSGTPGITAIKPSSGSIPTIIGKKWTTRNGTVFTFHADGTGTQELNNRKVTTKWSEGQGGLIVVEGDRENKRALWYFRFTGPKEATFGSSPTQVDQVLSVK